MGPARERDGAGSASRSVIFNLLRDSPQTTRTELAARSGLSKPTVSEIVAALLKDGFLRETGKFSEGRGRSRILLELVPTARLVLGTHLGDGVCTAVLADLRARPLRTASRFVAGTDPGSALEAITTCVDELRADAGTAILGVGVGVPGSVDPAGRRVTISVPYGWRDVPIADLLEERLGLPVLATNRAKAATLGELWRGGHPAVEHLFYVFVGRGIVAGIVANSALYVGAAGGAGELGHMTILPDGPLCGCGNHGCLHTLASESAIVRGFRARVRQHPGVALPNNLAGADLGTISLQMLHEAARHGDPLVLETVREAGAYLGIALANVVNLINPSRIIIGGPVAGFGEPLFEAVRAEVHRRALWDSLSDLAIAPSSLGDDAGPIGAAALLLERVALPLKTLTGDLSIQ